MRSGGSAADVARAFCHVKQRCADLLRLNVDELEETGLRTASIVFQPRPLGQQQQQQQPIDEETENVIGQLNVDEDWNVAAIKTLPQRRSDVTEQNWSTVDDDDDDDIDAAAEAQGK